MAEKSCRPATRSRNGSSAMRGFMQSILLTASTTGRPTRASRASATSSPAAQRGAATTRMAASAPPSAASPSRFMKCASRLPEAAAVPGVSVRIIRNPGPATRPSTRCRVVCGFGVTMLSLRPASAFRSVDLPTFGRPASTTVPQRWVCSGLTPGILARDPPGFAVPLPAPRAGGCCRRPRRPARDPAPRNARGSAGHGARRTPRARV